jgi:hypothetical protein
LLDLVQRYGVASPVQRLLTALQIKLPQPTDE